MGMSYHDIIFGIIVTKIITGLLPGVRKVKQSLLKTIRLKYKITDAEVYDKAYSYIEIYY